MNAISHSGIREAIRARIVAGEWKLGELIPGEADFAEEYGCSRTTVNRALQALADEGIVERKRKGGTRVRPLPLPPAQLRIPLLREQVEESGAGYRCEIRERKLASVPADLRGRLKLGRGDRAVYLETLHLADDRPFAFETRWVNLATVPEFEHAEFGDLSANEWLVRRVPFTRGEVAISASAATADVAAILGATEGAALFTMERTTWLDDRPVTAMTLIYAAGYRLEFTI
ncbi:GntR family transcriptional regulator [Qipengyuania qiaonensis]|uniref:UTRA domain-containing protein n=1 Tax=Qipengyuania qiaonensis TaxID=2867240 RepID=A0ABS7J603_9SPHN|nr:UTRA domain-containing protein [Qipengyuania qiaonensis]